MIQTLQYLSEAAKIVDSDNRTNKLLHCYYLSRIQCLAAVDNITVEKSSNSSCDKCTIPFSDTKSFSLSIKPRKITKQKYKKLVTKSECKSRNDSSILKLKGKLGQKYKRLVYNIAETTCKLCHSKRKSSIRFDTKDKSKTKPDPPIVQLSQLESIKPKKRKRDRNAGLIIAKDDRVDLKNSISSPKPTIPTVQPINKVIPTKLPVKVKQTKPKTNKEVKKSKNSANNKKTQNVTSAQKQRKGILLLANVLKMNDMQQGGSHQSKLSKMFK